MSVISHVDITGAAPRPESERTVATNVISPGWLAAYGMRMRAGRDFDNADVINRRPVALVNDAFVHRFFPDGQALGRTFSGGDSAPRTIIGVVSDAVYNSLREPTPPTAYLPSAPAPVSLTFSVRVASARPSHVASAIARVLLNVKPDLAFSFRRLDDQVDATLNQDRLLATLSAFFGPLALLLAGLGLYGVTAYAVARRRTEIGIRMALGAAPAGVIRLVMVRVSLLVGVGVVIGLGMSLWASKFVASLLYGLEPRDPATLTGAVVTLTAVGAVAGWLPAWRASRIDPAEVLRSE
jgi:putative ABC transport system permease protein